LTGKRVSESYETGFDASWELDLFRRVRRSVEAANTDLGVTEADRLSLLVVVTSDVDREYLELRGLLTQWDVAQHNVEIQEDTLKIT
jgi:multidrug efflux system outer membrane protein